MSAASSVDYAALEKAELRTEPFDYLVVPGFLRPEALSTLRRDFPQIRTPGNHMVEQLKFGPAFGDLLEELNGPEFASGLGRQFHLDLSGLELTVGVRRYCEASDGNIHTDHWSKVITTLLYFNDDWQHAGGRLRMLRGKEDMDDYSEEVTPAGGTLLAFRRTPHSFHGHKRFVGERLMLQASFVRPARSTAAVQKVRELGRRLRRLQPGY